MIPVRLSVLFLAACLAGSAQAGQSIITVTTIDDVIAADGQCALREAIINANNNAQTHSDCDPGDPVDVDYIYFDSSLAGATITLNGTALPVITDELRVVGPVKFDPDGLSIDAAGASRIFIAQGSVPGEFELRLTGLTLTGGKTTGPHQHGGAVWVENADLALHNARVTGSETTGFQAFGGGIAVIGGNADLRAAVVSGNATAGNLAAGGGLMVQGGLGLEWTAIEDNHTTGSGAVGGGVAAGDGGAFVSASTIAGNTTGGIDAHGGGLAVTSGGTTLLNSTVSGNEVSGAGAEGGGVWVNSGATLLRHATVAFNRNSAGGVGGIAVSLNSSDDFDLQNSVVAQHDGSGFACNAVSANPVGSLATDGSCTGSGGVALESLKLLPLADNGSLLLTGANKTHAFFHPSFLLNQGGDCVANYSTLTDQRGYPRPGATTTACDIGAFELQGPIQAELEILPSSVDFATVPIGQSSAPATVTLDSHGNAALDIQALQAPGAPFSRVGGDCDTPPFTLNPDQSCTLEYRFSPTAAGSEQQVLEVTSTDPASPHAITLSGEAVFDGCVTDSAELQNALTIAGNNGQPDHIRIAAGFYPAPPGGFAYSGQGTGGDDFAIVISGGWTGSATSPCDEQTGGAFDTVLDGNGADQVLRIHPGPSSDVAVSGLTLQNGLAAGFARGGGLQVSPSIFFDYSGSIEIRGNIFLDNEAHSGGGLSVRISPVASGAVLHVTGNLFAGNHARNGFGIAELSMQSGDDEDAELFLIGNTALGNTAGEPDGFAVGGIQVAGPVAIRRVVANNLLWGNQNQDLAMHGSGGYELLHNNIGQRGGFEPVIDAGNLQFEPVFLACPGACNYWAPASGSALIDAGYMPANGDGWSLDEFDLAGRPRLDSAGGTVDIGAFENHDRLFADRFEN